MSDAPVVFTAATVSYLARVRVLADSIAKHWPGVSFAVGLADRLDPSACPVDLSGIEVIPVEDVAIPGFAELARRTLADGVTEFVTATKPFFFQHLLARAGVSRVLFLDPDTELFEPLQRLDAELAAAELLLTPHFLEPPGPERADAERKLMRYGVFNPGIVGVSRGVEGQRFLAWWGQRLAWRCSRNVKKGFFVDQKLVDAAPAYFPGTRIHRDPGVNVGTWNLFERPVTSRAGGWRVGGAHPLRLFHFSRYEPGEDWLPFVEGIAGRCFTADEKALYEGYGQRLFAAGHARVRNQPCAFAPPADRPRRGVLQRLAAAVGSAR
ncbi:MAG: hypothetical protein MJE66_14670 [Proteobacteria bacterium]|nr:hypothetical protein [Pseudomonadota bacterium]